MSDNTFLEGKHLGGGTVLFENAITVPQDDLILYLEQEKERWRQENFTVIYDDNGEPMHTINKGGFIYGLDAYKRSPVRMLVVEIWWSCSLLRRGCKPWFPFR